MKVNVFNIAGEKTGEQVELSDAIFAAPVSEHAVYLDVKAIQANQRQGTHSSKTRSAVSGGGKNRGNKRGVVLPEPERRVRRCGLVVAVCSVLSHVIILRKLTRNLKRLRDALYCPRDCQTKNWL